MIVGVAGAGVVHCIRILCGRVQSLATWSAMIYISNPYA